MSMPRSISRPIDRPLPRLPILASALLLFLACSKSDDGTGPGPGSGSSGLTAKIGGKGHWGEGSDNGPIGAEAAQKFREERA